MTRRPDGGGGARHGAGHPTGHPTGHSPSHRSSRPAAALGVLLLALALVAVACSKGSDDASSPTTAADRSTTTVDEAVASTTTPYAVADGQVATGKPVASAGCGTSEVGAVTKERHTVGDTDRWYLVTTPKDHDGSTPLPLVLDLHGLSEGAEIHSMMTGMDAYGAEHGFVTVYPNGTGTPVAWNVSSDRKANPDLVYLDALLDQVEGDLCIDTSRVYATGLSNGAMMSSVLACAMSDRIAAVAPVSGLMLPDPCDPERRVPVLAFHGTADPILIFNGGVGTRLGSVLDQTSGGDPVETPATSSTTEAPLPEADPDGEGYPQVAAEWAKANRCTGDPTDEQLTETVTRRTWDCPATSPVIFDIIDGGGHSWPGSEFSAQLKDIVGPTDTTIDANQAAWEFFQRFQLATS